MAAAPVKSSSGDWKGSDSKGSKPGMARSWSTHFDKIRAHLEVKKVKFAIKEKKGGQKVIVDNISLSLKSGDILAMMGPSGAGKTTLLDLMTMKISGRGASGSVTLNGHQMTERRFRDHAAMCEQYDTHCAFLTCKEIMNYAAELYISDAAERDDRVESIMEHLGLMECANVKAGNIFLKGMSGGQRKRLSLGLVLLKGPNVLFLDEPTSGLDAASTKGCMKFINDFATEAQMIVIATIHQPSTEVFMAFTKVLFLANGRTAYLGSPGEVDGYCQAIAHPLPALTNPADFFIQLINSEFVGREQVDDIVNIWRSRPHGGGRRISVDEIMVETKQSRPGVMRQFCTLTRRNGLLAIRDPSLYVGRMVAFVLSNTFFALIYIKARDREQQYAIARFMLIGWFGAVPSMFSIVVVYSTNEEFQMSRKDVHNGMLHVRTMILSKLALQIPAMFLLSICVLLIPSYIVANSPWEGFGVSVLLLAVMNWAFECMSECLGIGIPNPLLGMLGSVMLWFCAFLFSGLFLKPEFILWPFRIFCYILPLRYTLRGLNYAETHGTIWEQAELTPTGGFTCPTLSPFECFGYTGDQVRASLVRFYGVLSEEDTLMEDLCCTLLIAVVFKTISCGLLIYKTVWVTPLKPLDNEEPEDLPIEKPIREDSQSSLQNSLEQELATTTQLPVSMDAQRLGTPVDSRAGEMQKDVTTEPRLDVEDADQMTR